MSDFDLRFGGISRLYGRAGLERLRLAHVCVAGIGGVGSWVAEALARSGLGRLTLVDLDEICLTNVNRQIHAVDGMIGQGKVETMAARCRTINPECHVQALPEFFTPETADSILAPRYDFIVDAIDNMANKCLLIARCRERRQPLLTIGGAGGRRDPTLVRIRDLADSSHDPLLAELRRRLRKEHGFPLNPTEPFGLDCVFSTEPILYPQSDGTVCDRREPYSELRLNCESGYGTASFVTGTFGLVAAGHVVTALATSNQPQA